MRDLRIILTRVIISCTLLGFIFQSCQTIEDNYIQQNSNEKVFSKFKKSSMNIISTMKLVRENTMMSRISYQEDSSREELEELANNLIIETKELLNHFDYGDAELLEDFDNLNDPRIGIVGLMILSSGGKARVCFMETTGIATGVALVGAITAKTLDKKLIKTLIKKVVKKVGGRALGGIGLALMAADFAYCMLSAEYKAIAIDRITAKDLVKVYKKSFRNFRNKSHYYILKKDINYKSIYDYSIDPYTMYNVYNISEELPSGIVTKYPYQVYGKDINETIVINFLEKQEDPYPSHLYNKRELSFN